MSTPTTRELIDRLAKDADFIRRDMAKLVSAQMVQRYEYHLDTLLMTMTHLEKSLKAEQKPAPEEDMTAAIDRLKREGRWPTDPHIQQLVTSIMFGTCFNPSNRRGKTEAMIVVQQIENEAEALLEKGRANMRTTRQINKNNE